MIIAPLIITLIMLVFSAFFSMSEMAFNASNKIRLKGASDDGKKGAKLAYEISEDFAFSLCAILIGNNLANIAASTCATMIFVSLLGSVTGEGVASVIATVALTFVVLIFGEIVPKILGKAHADTLVTRLALPVKTVAVILYPIVFIVMGLIKLLSKLWGKDESEDAPTVTEDEFATIIDTVANEGVIDEEQSELIKSTLSFPDTTVFEIMTPRIDLETICIEDDIEEIEKQIENSTYTRIPVYRDDIDDIEGILILNRYYRETVGKKPTKETLEKMLSKPTFIHKTMKLPMALDVLRKKKTHLAIVIDEFGGTLGAVTVEDILEELVGEIWDENEEVTYDVTEKADNVYEIAGDMNLDDFFEAVEVNPGPDFECEYSTVGGFAIEMLDSNPEIGKSFTFMNLSVTVKEMDEMRIISLGVVKTPETSSEDLI